jgi:DnaJ-class molecular chaperone
MQCPTCDGKGYVLVTRPDGVETTMKCTLCKGSGEVPDPDEDNTCPKCKGKGTITILATDGTERYITCNRCDGTGKI